LKVEVAKVLEVETWIVYELAPVTSLQSNEGSVVVTEAPFAGDSRLAGTIADLK
jgi:hypothetical protein